MIDVIWQPVPMGGIAILAGLSRTRIAEKEQRQAAYQSDIAFQSLINDKLELAPKVPFAIHPATRACSYCRSLVVGKCPNCGAYE